MEKVIYDCDNTMGVPRSDIDDGLTFLYLYGHPDIEVLGLTLTFANNTLTTVYANTEQMLDDLGIKDIPVLRGGRDRDDYEHEAARFLVKTVDENPGEITVIATGSMQNLYSAFQMDPQFFEKIKRVMIMGGILEHLYINGAYVRELNFSVAPKAAYEVFKHCRKIDLFSSQTTAQAYFGKEEIQKIYDSGTKLAKYLQPIIEDWCEYLTPKYHEPCFHNWDLVPAIYLTNPEYFDTSDLRVVVDEAYMWDGLIPEDQGSENCSCTILNHPTKINQLDAFNQKFIEVLKLADEKCRIRYYPQYLYPRKED